jgi:serum/glucocorticoid-regulated kinase 2
MADQKDNIYDKLRLGDRYEVQDMLKSKRSLWDTNPATMSLSSSDASGPDTVVHFSCNVQEVGKTLVGSGVSLHRQRAIAVVDGAIIVFKLDLSDIKMAVKHSEFSAAAIVDDEEHGTLIGLYYGSDKTKVVRFKFEDGDTKLAAKAFFACVTAYVKHIFPVPWRKVKHFMEYNGVVCAYDGSTRISKLTRMESFLTKDTEAEDIQYIDSMNADSKEAKRLPDFADEPVELADFDVLKAIGRSSFGRVLLGRKKESNQMVAIKVMRKDDVRKHKQVDRIKNERKLVQSLHHPFILSLKYAFQTVQNLYLATEYCAGGELFYHLRARGTFKEEEARPIIAELILAIGYIHSQGYVYRDLKPDNILLDGEGHIRLFEFALTKKVSEENQAHTFCGTPEYLSPEMIQGREYGKATDWWQLGIILYEMLVGMPPFYSENAYDMYRRIVEGPLLFPASVSEDAKDLIAALLIREPYERLGASSEDANAIQVHKWFSDTDWDVVLHKQLKPTFIPVEPPTEMGAASFDEKIRRQPIVDDEEMELSPDDNTFANFDYTAAAQ